MQESLLVVLAKARATEEMAGVAGYLALVAAATEDSEILGTAATEDLEALGTAATEG